MGPGFVKPPKVRCLEMGRAVREAMNNGSIKAGVGFLIALGILLSGF